MKFTRCGFITIFIVILFSACKRNVIQYYTTGISLGNYDNCGTYLQPASDSVGDTCYVMRINYISDQTAYYAVDDKNTYAIANRPVSIEITSLQQFDSLHPIGTVLNDYFIAGPGINSTTEDVVTGFANTKDYYPTHDPDDLWLMKRPENTGSFRFIVKMDFDDGAIVRDTTSAVNLVR